MRHTPSDRIALLTEAAETLLSMLETDVLVPAILDISQRLFAADAYAVWRLFPDQGQWRTVADRNLSPEYTRTTPTVDLSLIPDRPVFTPDVMQDPLLAARQEAYRAEGIRSMLYLPLRVCGEKAGTIVFYFRQPHSLATEDLSVAQALSNLAAAALTNAELYARQRKAAEAAEAAERRLQFLAEAGAVLAASLDFEQTLRHITHLAVPHLADWCAVHLLGEGGEIRLAEVAHADAEKTRKARRLSERYPIDPGRPRGIPQVLRTGQPELFTEIPDELLVQRAQDPEHLALLRGVGFKACIIVPLRLRDRTFGALSLVSAESGRPYTESDLRLAEALGTRAAAAIENARLFEQVQHALTTARKTEDELRASEERYRTFVAQSSEGIWRFEVDEPIAVSLPPEKQIEAMYRQGYLAECNDAMARMYGYERAGEIVGARMTDLLDPADPANTAYLQAFIESGYHLTDAESHELDRDGQPIVILNNLVGVVEEGCLVRAWGTQRDITAQRRAEQGLRDSEERLTLATRAAGIGTFDWHIPSGRLIWSDQEHQLFGLEPGSFEGDIEAWARRVLPEDLDPTRQSIAEAMREQRRELDFAFRIVRPDGQLRWIEGSARFLYAEDGSPLRMVGVNVDATPRRELENELRRKVAELGAETRRKDEFLAMLAHELRNPLAPIATAAAVLRLRGPEDPAVKRQREVIERNVKHLARLVDDLLEVSRINEGRIELRREAVDLVGVAEEAAATTRSLFEDRGHQLTLSLPARRVSLDGDPTRLLQVLVNLLGNAARYTPPGGQVELQVTLDEAAEQVSLCVRDNGRGIDPELLPRIFDLFVQGPQSLARTEGGLGIGLTLVRRLVEMHGGTVTALSEGPGRGSEFIVLLPVTDS